MVFVQKLWSYETPKASINEMHLKRVTGRKINVKPTIYFYKYGKISLKLNLN